MPILADFENIAKSFKNGIPVALLPVRLETRFLEKNKQKQICIRVFPDEIAINQLNSDVSAEETSAGKAYWSSAAAAGNTDAAKKEAFRALSARFGAPRAAMLVNQTNPQKPFEGQPIGQAWTGASSTVMPDYFVFYLFRSETDTSPSLTIVGNKIPRPLPVGLNPAKSSASASPVPLWLSDFDAAVAAGMAVVQALDNNDFSKGFYKIIALGLMAAANQNTSMGKLSGLLSAHRSSVGLEFLRPGTPTNNTAENNAALEATTNPDVFWETEFGKTQFEPSTDPLTTTDGQNTANALGLNAAVFQRTSGAGSFSRRNATAMNTALWPATIGFFLEEMLNFMGTDKHLLQKKYPTDPNHIDYYSELDIVPTLDKTRDFFNRHVKARGALPVIRVGKQPYGILPVGPVLSDAWRDASADGFEKNLLKLLRLFYKEWKTQADKIKTVDYTPPSGTTFDSESNFMKLLGQHAVSPGFFMRHSMSVESIEDDAWKDWQKWLQFGAAFQTYFFDSTQQNDPPVFEWLWKDDQTTPNDEALKGSGVKISGIFFKKYAQPIAVNLADALPPSESRNLPRHIIQLSPPLQSPVVKKEFNYLEWLARPDLNLEEMHKMMTYGQPTFPNADSNLLYILLRSAAFHQHWDVLMRVYQEAGVREGYFNNCTPAQLNYFGTTNDQKILFNPYSLVGSSVAVGDIFLNEIGTQGGTGSSPLTRKILDQIWKLPPIVRSNYRNGSTGLTKETDALKKVLEYLVEKGAASDYYERIINGNYVLRALGRLPYFSFKFSPTGPLPGIKAGNRTGIQYVQDKELGRKNFPTQLKPLNDWQANVNALAQVSTAELERLLAEHVDLCSHRLDAWYLGVTNQRLAAARTQNPTGIYLGAYGYVENIRPDTARKNTSYGYIHASSLDQAVTSAVLRSAYKTTGEDNERMAVKLSSRRVRMVLELFDGLRSGSSLHALLAKRLERELTERKALALWGPLRDKEVNNHIEPNGVVLPDVLYLIEKYRSAYKKSPGQLIDWVKSLLSIQNPQTQLVDSFRDTLNLLDDLLDAVGDLMLSESVYHLVRGDYSRAAASLETLTEGKLPPEPEFVRTPRSGIGLNHRSGVAFVPKTTTDSPEGWPKTLTPRASAEPSLNFWLGEMLGDPARFKCTASAVADSKDPKDRTEILITLADLKLHPLDWLHLFLEEWYGMESKLCLLLRCKVIEKDEQYANYTNWQFDFQTPGHATEKAFRKLAVWCRHFSGLIAQGRPLLGADWVHPNATLANSNTTLPGLLTRVKQLKKDFDQCITTLSSEVANFEKQLSPKRPSFEELKKNNYVDEALKKAALFGIPEAIQLPVAVFSSGDVGVYNLQLLSTAKLVLGRLSKMKKDFEAALPNDFTLSQGISEVTFTETCQRAVRTIFGNGFLIVPVFKPQNLQELQNALAPNPAFLPARPLVMEDWLVGAARVRRPMGGFEMALNTHSAFVSAPERDWKLSAFQLPFRANDSWVGAELPSDYWEKHTEKETRSKLSLIFWMPPAADKLNDFAGFVVDEWTEVIPSPTQTTGLAIHYNQPNASAPQNVLLAVHPKAHIASTTERWTADYLLQSVDTAIKLAKIRAIDPTHLTSETGPPSMFAHLLPGLLGRITDTASIKLDGNREGEWDFSTDIGAVLGKLFFQPANPPSGGGGGLGDTKKKN